MQAAISIKFVMLSTLCFLLLCAFSFEVHSAEDILFTEWKPYITPINIPPVVDLRKGGDITVMMTQLVHQWGSGMTHPVNMYGFKIIDENNDNNGDDTPSTFPGPTILVSKNVPIQVTWINNISAPHLLHSNIAVELMMPPSNCYPTCGVPLITHVHGLEVPPKYDGVPIEAIYTGQSKVDVYTNQQMSSTHVYHDHAMGLTRLNLWAGLMGLYIIEDAEAEAARNIIPSVDMALVISDTMVSTEGVLMYTQNPCKSDNTHWAPEAYGSVNAVNGVVFPYVEVPHQAGVKLRIVNAANSRAYGLDLPFYEACIVIGVDMGLLNVPYALNTSDQLLMFSLERYDLVCDFSTVEVGSTYEVINTYYPAGTEQTFPGVFQLRVVEPSPELQGMVPTSSSSAVVEGDSEGDSESATVATTSGISSRKPRDADSLNRIKDLQQLHLATGGQVRNISLEEVLNAEGCPTQLVIKMEGKISSYEKHNYVTCQKGKVEKWMFSNPTADVHPFHWHAIGVQCGNTEDTIDTNSLKDTVQIPNTEGDATVVTQVCYVACVPNGYLEEGSTVGPLDFGFSTLDPYVMHCHMLEHEENAMMTYFYISDDDDSQFKNGIDPKKVARTYPRMNGRQDLKVREIGVGPGLGVIMERKEEGAGGGAGRGGN